MSKPTKDQIRFMRHIAAVAGSFHQQFPRGVSGWMRDRMERAGWIAYEQGGYVLTDAGRTIVDAKGGPLSALTYYEARH